MFGIAGIVRAITCLHGEQCKNQTSKALVQLHFVSHSTPPNNLFPEGEGGGGLFKKKSYYTLCQEGVKGKFHFFKLSSDIIKWQ